MPLDGYFRAVSEIRSVCVASVKGGVAKTTTSFALLAAAAERGMMAVGLDLDASRGLTKALGIEGRTPTILDVLTRRAKIDDAVVHTQLGVFSVPGDRMLYRMGFQDEAMIRLFEEVSESADLVIIDTHPGDNRLQVAFDLADVIVVPTTLDRPSFRVVTDTLLLAEECGALPRIGGILPSNFKPRNIPAAGKDLLHRLTKWEVVYGSFIPYAAAWEKALTDGTKPPAKNMKDAQELLDEVLSNRCDVANLRAFVDDLKHASELPDEESELEPAI